MTDRELLEQILAKLDSMDKRLKNVESDISEIKATVKNNHDKTIEFYGEYKEGITEISEKLDNLSARQEIFENQTIKNTAELRRIK